MRRVLPQALGLAYAAAFVACFLACRLYGTADDAHAEARQPRWSVAATSWFPDVDQWQRWVPLLSTEVTPEFLAQRVKSWGPALGIWLAALLAGELLLFAAAGRRAPRGWERFALAHGLGIGAVSLATLGIGLAGGLTRTPFAFAAGVLLAAFFAVRPWRREPLPDAPPLDEPPPFSLAPFLLPFATLFCGMVFSGFALLAASIPTMDFDANAYHLLGPKEWFLAGRIEFLPHNVYTTFPFLTEMLHLLGMVVCDNWAVGALAGQELIWTFGPLGAVAAGLLAKDCFGGRAGWWAAFVYITTPWVFRLAAIPYVEGPLMFYTALAFLFARRAGGAWFAGCLAGCAASCKYTGIVNALIPAFAMVLCTAWPMKWLARRNAGLAFALGVAMFFGPWLVRNAVWTGNPVYPLAYKVFGGKNWSPEKAAKFARGHRSNSFNLADLSRYTLRPTQARDAANGSVFGEIPVRSDWQSGLVFAFAPLALLQTHRRRFWWLAGIAAYEFAVFFFLTHRLDRFWLPLLPFAVALAGGGLAAVRGFGFKLGAIAVVALVTLAHHAYCMSDWCVGSGRYYYRHADEVESQWSAKAMRFIQVPRHPLGERGAPNAECHLLVGDAAAFRHSYGPAIYNSVFDDCIFETIFRAKPGEPATANGVLSDATELRRRLAERKIAAIWVDWNWINTYRAPGNYGFTDFVRMEVFNDLMEMKLLNPIGGYIPPYHLVVMPADDGK